MDSLVIYTMVKVALVIEDDSLQCHVVLRAVVLTICVHVVLCHAAVWQWCWHYQDGSWRASLLAECLLSWLLDFMHVRQFVCSLSPWFM